MERRHAMILAVHWIARLIVGGAFVYAGALKSANPARFADGIEAYRLLPYFGSALLAVYLPWLEMICGAGLILGWLRNGAALILMVLTALFALAAASAWVRGLDISCGCFGGQPASHGLPALMLVRDGLILVALAFVRRTFPCRACPS